MFKYILKKEFLLVFRNLHALGVLFIMPMAFILIMSLALKDTYSASLDKPLNVLILTDTEDKNIQVIQKDLKNNGFFNFEVSHNSLDTKTLLYDKEYEFVVSFPNKIFSKMYQKEDFEIKVYNKPETTGQRSELLKSFLVKSISTIYMKNMVQIESLSSERFTDLTKSVSQEFIYKNDAIKNKPTSVQQSVPSWIVFSMFFIVIPLSNTFIQEKMFGTTNRIKSINVSFFPLLLGKVVPYFVINQIQVILMLLVGFFIVPQLGGDSLVVNGDWGSLFVVSSVISFAAIGFALMVSNVARSSEEATAIGGLSNIILAALGGIMVPKFVMPVFMQEVTEYSPMSWALESFLEIIVRGGNLSDISHNLFLLLGFGIIMLTIANILLNRKKD